MFAQASFTSNLPAKTQQKYISDMAQLIKPEFETQIAKLCNEIEQKMRIRVLVKTEKFADMSKSQNAADNFFTDWIRQIALDKRGVLIYAAVTDNSSQGKIYLKVGIGLKYLITKEMGRKIIEQVILPQNSLNKDGKAFLSGVEAIKTMLIDEFKRAGSKPVKGNTSFSISGFLWASKEILLAFVIAILLCYVIFFVERCPRCNAMLRIEYEVLKEPGVNTLGVKRKIYICEKCGFSRRKKEPVYPRGKAGWWMRIAGVRRNVKIE